MQKQEERKYMVITENEDACINKAKEMSVPQTQAHQAI